MRKPTDECLLCKVNAANKTNSHILPRFISTGFLGAKGAPRKGFLLNGINELTAKPKTVQDSPKEDYILCEECEAYFSLVETASAPAVKFWQTKAAEGELKIVPIHPHLKLVQLNSPEPVVMRLLVYSMFWRADISDLGTFKNYKLDSDLAESLRCSLLEFKALANGALQANLKTKEITLHPYATMTAGAFKDETANVLAAINPGNPASLHVDKFGFYIFKAEKDIAGNFMADFSNIKISDNQIMVVSEQLWYDVMVKRPLEMAVEQAKKNLLDSK
ncbi:hypothetical protein [Mucilaginibacter sp.]|uniref:hypothetical protein n=1 Tax=Mucilaginibacter sp. TaxID=1882438 RepID=UPI000CAFBB7A|nr:hypothetical protein [Mucilaginibacter sp.]PLW88519.1 MAG: hypothetical protein C0154_16475 [Mucilaginibacter sp.]PMP66224.1 MAG: hypothetical protein C0191_01445 [Mucilaginibacter sp.]HEK22204.1 hypothetical protein [Bacteroidota bacterium]